MCALTTVPPRVCAWAVKQHTGTYVVYGNKPQSSSYFSYFKMFLNNLNEAALYTVCKTAQSSGEIFLLRDAQKPPGHGPE